ncbi:MAG: CRTAC1 family protein [Myxococcales bacterium]|nr:CRTAC1 family protein [Myxococcales bacterium]
MDVTAAAGLGFDPGELHAPPFCLLDDINYLSDGDYCTPERFLGAAAVGDFDGDDWPDVVLTRRDGPGLLMRNRGDGTFEDVTVARGVEQAHVTGGAAWLDIEGDGDLDLMLTGFGTLRHYLYVNDGTGSFQEDALAHGTAVPTELVHVGTSIGVGDYDLDGYLDVFVGDWRAALILGVRKDHNRLLHNLGAQSPGHFEDVTVAMGIELQEASQWTASGPGAFGFAPAFVDLDGDHWPELALAADYGSSRLYWNDAGVLHEGTAAAGVLNDAHGMGSTFGDYDGDGDLDWFISAIWYEDGPKGNRLYRNDGGRSFTEQTDDKGVRDGGWGWGTAFFDADHDGDLDLALASGWPSTNFDDDPVRLWINEGPGVWPERAVELGIDYQQGGRGLVPFDYDRDGDLDLLVHSNTETPVLYRNDGAEGSWLQVRAEGRRGNPRSIGAEVRVQAQPGDPWQVRHIGVGSHLFGQPDAVAHFGLGPDAQPLHEVRVLWPASGREVVLANVARDQVLVVSE